MDAVRKLRQYGVAKFIRFAAAEVRLVVYDRWLLGSYSQVHEDLVLDRLTGHKKRGFYVDIGAYDPYRFSNTMRFYRRGWTGINIEPNTDHWRRFTRIRTRDINLNIGVGKKRTVLTFYSMDPPTLSTFSRQRADEYRRDGFVLHNKNKVPVLPLKDVLSKHAKGKRIDFLSVDVEGYEMEVLGSNDWKKFRPRFLCIETAVDNNDREKTEKYRKTINTYLGSIGYASVFDNGLNTFYRDMHEA